MSIDDIPVQASSHQGHAPATREAKVADSPDHNETTYPTKISALRLLLVRLIDRGIPKNIQAGDSDDLRRARIILSFTLILIALAFVAGFYITWILPPAERPKIIISLFIALVATGTVPIIFKYFFSLALAANLVLFSGYVVTPGYLHS